MYLFLNNLSEGQIFLALFNQKGIKDKIIVHSSSRRANLLIWLNKLLTHNRCSLEKIKGLVVVNGPGLFSAIRTALAIINTLADGLKIPAVGVSLASGQSNEELIELGQKKLMSQPKNKRIVLPFYGAKPNISRPKNRNLI